MVKLLVAVIAFATVSYLAYAALNKTKLETAEDRVAHAPKRQLDNVRAKAKQFEQDDEQRAKEIETKTAGE